MADTRDIPRGLPGRRLIVSAALIAICALGALEGGLRLMGYQPDGGYKQPREWSAHLADGDGKLLIVGDSRAAWGVSCEAVERGRAAAWGRPMACSNGAVIWGHLPTLLPRLAAGEITPRLLVIGISPASLYSPVFQREFAPMAAGFAPLSATERLDVATRRWIRSHLVIAASDLSTLGQMILGRAAQKVRHRQDDAGWNRMSFAPGALEAARRFQISAYSRQFLRPLGEQGAPDPDGHIAEADLQAAEAEVLAAVARLRQRGVKIVMVRLPIGPEVAEVEASLSLARRLAPLAEAAGVPYRDFTALGLAVADESHMDEAEAARFSEALGRWLGRAQEAGGR